MKKRLISSGSRWEPIIGFSRAVRTGQLICVSGCTGVDVSGEITNRGDPYGQAVQALQNVRSALESADASLADVVRTRIYLVRIEDWEAVARAHVESFGDIRPATTMVQVQGLVAAEMLVEIEADAVVTD